MSAFLASLTSFWGRLAANTAKYALWTGTFAFLGPLGPIIGGIAQFIGGTVTAIAEILVSLSKSPEGRVALCLIVAGLSFLYMRFHYLEEGRTEAKMQIAALQKPCHASGEPRRRR